MGALFASLKILRFFLAEFKRYLGREEPRKFRPQTIDTFLLLIVRLDQTQVRATLELLLDRCRSAEALEARLVAK